VNGFNFSQLNAAFARRWGARGAQLMVASLGVALLAALVVLLLPATAWAEGSKTDAFAEYAAKGPAIAIGASFISGIAASMTPCVWPMIPITLSIFGATEAKSRARGAALSGTFVLGIAALFTPMGIVAALSGGVMGSALAKPAVVIGIAILFIVLAASMFGAFEMTLPSSITNKMSTVGGVGFKGAFFLGLALGLVAAPCTGPFATGLITWIATTKNVFVGGAAMFAFACGIGVPFFFAGTFALNLPKGGAWMMGIKWGSGVVLAYMSFSYLRDRWPTIFAGFLTPAALFGIVGGVVLAIGLVLGGIHIAAERRKSPIAHLSKPMKLASIVPAVAGAYVLFSWIQLPPAVVAPTIGPDVASAATVAPIIGWGKDEAATRASAREAKKPVLVDFGASWCGACKELEHKTWPDPAVRAEAARFATIAVDGTDDEDATYKTLVEKYKVKGLPTVVLLDATGEERARFTEFVPAAKMAAAMKEVR
jgi:thioredoxin:protein disulfide reductase